MQVVDPSRSRRSAGTRRKRIQSLRQHDEPGGGAAGDLRTDRGEIELHAAAGGVPVLADDRFTRARGGDEVFLPLAVGPLVLDHDSGSVHLHGAERPGEGVAGEDAAVFTLDPRQVERARVGVALARGLRLGDLELARDVVADGLARELLGAQRGLRSRKQSSGVPSPFSGEIATAREPMPVLMTTALPSARFQTRMLPSLEVDASLSPLVEYAIA